MLDFNRACLSQSEFSVALNELIEAAEPRDSDGSRNYLGASSIGSECLRRVQYDWMVEPRFPSQTRDIFARGHFFEELARQHFKRIGFQLAPPSRLAFSTAGGLFRGHADGILLDGPKLPGVGYPCLWEHKGLGDKGWRKLERDGVEKTYPHYAAQVYLYQAYLDAADHPAIFTATNANTCERVHVLVPFDAAAAQAWSDRAVTIIKATQAGELLPRAYDSRTDWRCKACGHTARCWGQE
jgi:hypothetical protein